MKNWMILAVLFAAFSCGGKTTPPDPTPGSDVTPDPAETPIATPSFAKGADISWYPEMKSDGKSFRKKDGSQAELPEVLKDAGFNAVRLRVWVDPYQGHSGKAEVLQAAEAAKAAGLALMIDFHYSDFFADPSRQKIPAAWEADKNDLDKMCQHVSSHTSEVLKALKDKGVKVHWVQIGNETRNGMLWPAGQLWTAAGDIPDGRANFAKLYNAGYDAAKAVFPDAVVMPHIDNAYANDAWWFKQIKEKGGKFDAIALSHYPHYESKLNGSTLTPEQVNSNAINAVKSLYSTYGVPVYIAEVGVNSSRSGAAALLASFMSEIRKISGCKGVFYWEPEVYGNWKPAIYSKPSELSKYTGTTVTSAWGAYDQGAFTSTGAPSAVLDCFAD